MARPLRLEFEGAVYHITNRGNSLGDIFLADSDRERFLEVLAGVVDRYSWQCHAYCQMTNHYHLLIETPDANLSQGMRQLNGIYTQWINREHRRTGHVFQGRFKSVLIEKESHLLEVARYIVLNPVRAKMVRSTRDWRWSSYHATAGQDAVPAFLTVGWLLSQFDSAPSRATARYREFVRRGRAVVLWEQLRRGGILGSDDYVERIKPLLDAQSTVVEIAKPDRLAGRPTLESLFSDVDDKPTRNERIYLATRVHGYTLKDVGNFLGLYYSTISTVATRVAESETPRKKT